MAIAKYHPLASVALTSTQATVTFNNVPAGYRDLRLVVNATGTSEINIQLQINGDGTSSYAQVNMRGFGGSSIASSSTTTSSIVSNYSTGLQPSSRAVNIYDIMDYSSTSKHKSVLVQALHGDEVTLLAARWVNTSAITSVSVLSGATFAVGSTFTLYGVK